MRIAMSFVLALMIALFMSVIVDADGTCLCLCGRSISADTMSGTAFPLIEIGIGVSLTVTDCSSAEHRFRSERGRLVPDGEGYIIAASFASLAERS